MSRQVRQFWSWTLLATLLLTGCHPTQPFYLNEDGDLSHYLDVATKIEHPDVCQPLLEEAEYAHAPRTIANPEFDEIWDLPLEEAVQIAMHNAKVIKQYGQVTGGTTGTPFTPANAILSAPEAVATVYDPALQESNPGGDNNGARAGDLPGVEAALSEFDTQFSMSTFWQTTDRPQNVAPGIFGGFLTPVLQGQDATFLAEFSKKSASGTTFSARNNTIYSTNNQNIGRGGLPSTWLTNMEVEARHPFLRGGGTQVNRVPIVLARIRTDIALADFEAATRNMVSDVERAYWDLYFFYRNLEAAKVGRDSALVTWKKVSAKMEAGAVGGEAEKEAQARQQYFEFRARVEEALRDLYKSENRLRYLMGLTSTDNRLIRPSDEPAAAKVNFDWLGIHAESLTRSVELRRQKWRIKQREMQMIAARNELLPQLDAVALYRWLGLGDDLAKANGDSARFPNAGSTAFEELTSGEYQEWLLGFEMTLPVGFRRELASVRYHQLLCARERAVLDEMELEVVHQLTSNVQDLEASYILAQTNFNRRVAAAREVEAVQAAYDLGTVTLDLLLDAQRRQSQAEIDYYRSLVNYNVAIMAVHYRKGSLLEYNNIYLAEGPWPSKAYFDAMGHARRRDASYYLDYGYTRPKVISRGEVPQTYGEVEQYQDGETYLEEIEPGTIMQPTPAQQPMPGGMPAAEGDDLLLPTPTSVRRTSGTSRLEAAQSGSPRTSGARTASHVESFEWGSLGLKESTAAASQQGARGGASVVDSGTRGNVNESVATRAAAQASRPVADRSGL